MDTRVQQNSDVGIYVMYSNESVEGLSYFRSRFDSDFNPVYFTFEVDAVKNGFEISRSFLEKHYSDLGEPCYEGVDNAVAYKDGEFLVRLYEYTEDDINMGHPTKPRLKQHIGAVGVIIEYDIHPGTCGADISSFEELEDDHDHEH